MKRALWRMFRSRFLDLKVTDLYCPLQQVLQPIFGNSMAFNGASTARGTMDFSPYLRN